MADGDLLTPADFANKVRAKYPAYKDITDDKLVSAIIQKHPEYRDRIAGQQTAPMPQVDMKTSSLPGVVRGAAGALPVAGGMAGAITGAPAFGGGAVVGGALGAAAGESAREGVLSSIFGKDETSPVSKQGLKQTATAGLIGGASELPGALLQGYGKAVLQQLARAKSPTEVGDAIAALQKVAPFRISGKGMVEALDQAKGQLSGQFGKIVKSAQGTADVDQALQNVYQEARLNDMQFGTQTSGGTIVKGGGRVTRPLKEAITAARIQAKITGQHATVQQLADFRSALQQQAYNAQKTGASKIVQMRLQDAYRAATGELDKLAPEARPVLDQMTDIHAAKSAVRNYHMNPVRAAGVAAATNPRATTALSPLAIPAATEAAGPVKRAGRLAFEAIP